MDKALDNATHGAMFFHMRATRPPTRIRRSVLGQLILYQADASRGISEMLARTTPPPQESATTAHLSTTDQVHAYPEQLLQQHTRALQIMRMTPPNVVAAIAISLLDTKCSKHTP